MYDVSLSVGSALQPFLTSCGRVFINLACGRSG